MLAENELRIPGGVVSLNRKMAPPICFSRGRGSRVWDLDGNEYIDYQAAFSAIFLGHNDPDVNEAVAGALRDERVLMGAGPTDLEGELARLICHAVPSLEKVQLTNTGSEATFHAIRIARAHTGRDHVIIIQGGYNGWHNDVAANVISNLADVGPRVNAGEYSYDPLSAGIPLAHQQLVHPVNFNDLDSVRAIARKHPVACLLLEPVLQNVGVIKPKPGYLQGLRNLADELGFLLVFDEVKTGFRHAPGGYQTLCGVTPDLSTFGKAIANGYPLGVIGGKAAYMDYFIHPEKSRRVLIAGTYNAHPIPVAAAIATLKKLLSPKAAVYERTDRLGAMLEEGMRSLLKGLPVPSVFSRIGSAFCCYFMDHEPDDFHDLASHHDFEFDRQFRAKLISEGIFQFAMPIKQGSISYAHTDEDIHRTLEKTERVLNNLHRRH